MHEQSSDAIGPRQRLISLLQADFTRPDNKNSTPEGEGSAFASLLSQLVPIEAVDSRLASPESVELGEAVERLLAPAPVTTSFKGFIAHEVRRAHAWQSEVDEVISPDRLGLVNGDEIFDPARARNIEVQTLRGYTFDIFNRYTINTVNSGDATEPLPFLIQTARITDKDYTEAMATIDVWADEYEETYDEDPFANLSLGAYRDAAPRLTLSEGDDSAGFLEWLRQARDSYEGD